MHKHSQISMERMFMYALLLFIILITFGALFYYNIFRTKSYIRDECTIASSLGCLDHIITKDGEGNLYLENKLGEDLYCLDIDVGDCARTGHLVLETNEKRTFRLTRCGNLNKSEIYEDTIKIEYSLLGSSRRYSILGKLRTQLEPSGVIPPVPTKAYGFCVFDNPTDGVSDCSVVTAGLTDCNPSYNSRSFGTFPYPQFSSAPFKIQDLLEDGINYIEYEFYWGACNGYPMPTSGRYGDPNVWYYINGGSPVKAVTLFSIACQCGPMPLAQWPTGPNTGGGNGPKTILGVGHPNGVDDPFVQQKINDAWDPIGNNIVTVSIPSSSQAVYLAMIKSNINYTVGATLCN